ncbi:MAG: radical SAM protein [Candidatus Bathyarchaeia archaeon]
MNVIGNTKSLCPECLQVVDAVLCEENNIVYITKECKEHGGFKDVYWSDYEMYLRAKRFEHVGDGLHNPQTKRSKGCPFDCGICDEHRSHTALGIIDVTNRCNLQCPFCFAHAGAAGYLYEPSTEELKAIIDRFASNKPVKPPGLQFSGGEPTLREDLPELIAYAKKRGIHHVEVNTNGIRLAKSLDYCRELWEAGACAIYLQFDGVTPEIYLTTRGADLLKFKLQVIENCRKIGFDAVILVPTLIRGVNDHQLWDIVSFALENLDVVRCVNIQPVSICGRIDKSKLNDMRITIPDAIKLIEAQSGGKVKAEDFYPVPFVVPMSRAIGALRDHRYVEFTAHPHCGMATYMFVEDDGNIMPITRYGNIEKFMGVMEKVYATAEAGHKTRAKMRMLSSLRYVKGGLLRKLLPPILKTGSYKSLADLHYRMLMIGMMHFMDPYNFDLERVQRCCIHYGLPDGTLRPFCSYNTIHRPIVEKKFATSLGGQRES